jgi:stalled ribosome alternative rescue factor ArfA
MVTNCFNVKVEGERKGECQYRRQIKMIEKEGR